MAPAYAVPACSSLSLPAEIPQVIISRSMLLAKEAAMNDRPIQMLAAMETFLHPNLIVSAAATGAGTLKRC